MIKKRITLILTLVAILTISYGVINFESKVNKVQADNLYKTWMDQAAILFESLGDNAGQPDLSTDEE